MLTASGLNSSAVVGGISDRLKNIAAKSSPEGRTPPQPSTDPAPGGFADPSRAGRKGQSLAWGTWTTAQGPFAFSTANRPPGPGQRDVARLSLELRDELADHGERPDRLRTRASESPSAGDLANLHSKRSPAAARSTSPGLRG